MLHFKKWSRKPYAIFHSLGKQIKIARLSSDMLCAVTDVVKQEATYRDKTAGAEADRQTEHGDGVDPLWELLLLLGISPATEIEVSERIGSSYDVFRNGNTIPFFTSPLISISPPLRKLKFIDSSSEDIYLLSQDRQEHTMPLLFKKLINQYPSNHHGEIFLPRKYSGSACRIAASKYVPHFTHNTSSGRVFYPQRWKSFTEPSFQRLSQSDYRSGIVGQFLWQAS
ncbi:hypothetical protein V6R21_31230 [Limibacter armeniacum]|uniref:hypothetical protein n=1 Tax=Limibacter armeniacum TaxID=466084 RepID=UPI002FE6657E